MMTDEELESWKDWLATVVRTDNDKALLEQLSLDTKLAILTTNPDE